MGRLTTGSARSTNGKSSGPHRQTLHRLHSEIASDLSMLLADDLDGPNSSHARDYGTRSAAAASQQAEEPLPGTAVGFNAYGGSIARGGRRGSSRAQPCRISERSRVMRAA